MSGRLWVTAAPRGNPARCAFCHDDVPAEGFSCPGCGVVLHDGCVRELTRCPTIGCTRIPSRERARKRARRFLHGPLPSLGFAGAILALALAGFLRQSAPSREGRHALSASVMARVRQQDPVVAPGRERARSSPPEAALPREYPHALLEALARGPAHVRRQAAEKLGAAGSSITGATPALVASALFDDDASVRAAAARALAVSAPEEARATFEAALSDRDARVATAAEHALDALAAAR
jgi:hypothetical protein